MAIKISSTEVISDARALINITGATGVYDNFQPIVTSISVSSTINMSNPMLISISSAAQTFTTSNVSIGSTTVLLLDKTASNFIPTFPTEVKWPAGVEPSWTTYRYWLITFVGFGASAIMANAAGYNL
tara:strand:+ start:155 stop:538 length:384 start_codon:yes stop_codon:yes gene_type:complete